jgi:hypothetical protein
LVVAAIGCNKQTTKEIVQIQQGAVKEEAQTTPEDRCGAKENNNNCV